jgi:hypothetical protein
MDVVQCDHWVIPLVINLCDIYQFDEVIFYHNKKEQRLNSLCSFYISGEIMNCQLVSKIRFVIDLFSLSV